MVTGHRARCYDQDGKLECSCGLEDEEREAIDLGSSLDGYESDKWGHDGPPDLDASPFDDVEEQ